MSQPTLTPAEGLFGDLVKAVVDPAEHGGPGWIEFDSMINAHPRQGNRTRSVDDPEIRRRIATIVDRLVTP